jgi:hypothetical protein
MAQNATGADDEIINFRSNGFHFGRPKKHAERVVLWERSTDASPPA